jgi:hypothetical protein
MYRCPGRTAWPRCSSAGCSGLIKGRCARGNSTTTAKRLPFALTAAPRADGGCCSIGCWNRPWTRSRRAPSALRGGRHKHRVLWQWSQLDTLMHGHPLAMRLDQAVARSFACCRSAVRTKPPPASSPRSASRKNRKRTPENCVLPSASRGSGTGRGGTGTRGRCSTCSLTLDRQSAVPRPTGPSMICSGVPARR